MQFDSFADFIHMGGYAFYVWICFGFTLVLLLGLTISSVRQTQQIKTQVRESLHREQRIEQAKQADLL